MDCTAPGAVLPSHFSGARIASGVGVLERQDGTSGCFVLAPGWYYSDEGRSRIAAAVDRWQTRLDEMQYRIDSLQHAQTSTPHPCPAAPEHDAGSFAASALCLAVGFVLGRYSRRPRGAA